MGYRIETFSERFLEQHVKLGQKVSKFWVSFGQTPLEIMKKQYSSESFDPTTRWYAVDHDQLLGFCTSQIVSPHKARIEFPYVLDDNQKIEEDLYRHAVNELRSRGINKLVTRISDGWGDTVILGEKRGFQKTRDIYHQIKIVNSLHLGNSDLDHLKLIDYHEKDHKDVVIQFLTYHFDMSSELAADSLSKLNKSDGNTFHKLVSFKEKIVGRLVYATYNKDGSLISGASIIVEDEEHYKEILNLIFKEIEVCNRNFSVRMDEIFLGGLDRYLVQEYASTFDIYFTLSFAEKDV